MKYFESIKDYLLTDKTVLNKSCHIDYDYLYFLSNTLIEWSSIEDDESYKDL